jgi:hypothetical protein
MRLIFAAEHSQFLPLRKFLSRIAGPGLLALLAGCAARPDSAALQTASRNLAPMPASQTPKTIKAPEPHKSVAVMRVLPDPAPPQSPPPKLVGLSEDQLTDLLGTPTTRNGAGPGRHLYYRLPQCTLNLSLYPNVDTHIYKLLSYEVTGNDGHIHGKQVCDSELAAWLHTRQRSQARDEIAAGR